MFRNRSLFRFICIVLIFTLLAGLLVSCKKPPPEPEPEPEPTPGATVVEDTDDFAALLDELFSEWITEDSISLNYFLAYPENFGIEMPYPTFGEVPDPEAVRRIALESLELYDRITAFDYNDLSLDQQIVYDILVRDLELIIAMESVEDYVYYMGYIKPLNGIQVMLPVLLAEFSFRRVDDIEIYLVLLEDFQRYFSELVDFERERSRRGFFTSDGNVDKIIEHCESFLENREDNLMIVIFNDRIDEYEGLSEEQRGEFKRRNRELVLDNVLPAYDALVAAMRELRGQGAHQGGLADLPGGAEYAAAYLSYKTGSDRTPAEIDALFEKLMNELRGDLYTLYNSDNDLADKIFNNTLGHINDDTPEVYLIRLRKATARDYPYINPTRHVINEVHESLQEHVSPAFYLTPAIDCFDDNVIYINPSSMSDNLYLFTTLAHEGYPGHLYQTVYYLQQSPHPLRKVLGSTGYTEGWATYVEMHSYFYAGLPDYEAAFMQASKIFDLLFISRIDLGVNALGWGVDEVADLCVELGIFDRNTVTSLYETVIGNPLLYLPYSLGFTELMTLREEAQDTLGGTFDLVEFHRFILDFGSAPFPLIDSHMRYWMEAESVGGANRAA